MKKRGWKEITNVDSFKLCFFKVLNMLVSHAFKMTGCDVTRVNGKAVTNLISFCSKTKDFL